jgi:hypothetical protein
MMGDGESDATDDSTFLVSMYMQEEMTRCRLVIVVLLASPDCIKHQEEGLCSKEGVGTSRQVT